MANQEHLKKLNEGVDAWNRWRNEHQNILPDLSGANLRGANLNGAYLKNVDLSDADLAWSDLSNADLAGAYLSGAELSYATLNYANLNGTYLTNASVGYTIFGNVDLSASKSLDTVRHMAPSTIGIDTIYRSKGNIPEAFLREAGIEETFIAYMRSLVNNPIAYYTCFISYSSKDQKFVERLYSDLLSKGVRCWFAPKDMDIGEKIRPRIEESIQLYDKLLLVLSEHSIASNWVAYEVERALNKEPAGIPKVLFPIRLDEAVKKSQAQWANDIRSTRHIGDFSQWKDHDEYQKAFSRLLRALKTEAPELPT